MSKTLFIGKGTTAQCWYRCVLPATYLEDTEWVGIHYSDDPTKDNFGVMLGGSEGEYPDIYEYETIIIQQPVGEKWRTLIEEWQDLRIKVIYECDDFLHGIKKIPDHQFKDYFHKKRIKEYESCMKQCDAMICSTQFLSDQYKKYNKNQHVCLVSLDTKRYNIEFAPKKHTVIGWAGGTGHHRAVGPWLEVINQVMKRNPDVAFASIGTDYASALEPYHPGKTLSIPWTSIESYPYALTNFDLAICPSHDSKFYRAKSDLRWLEATALCTPTISSPITYGDVYQYSTMAENVEQFETELEDFIYDPSNLQEIAAYSNSYVRNERDISEGVNQWAKVIESVK